MDPQLLQLQLQADAEFAEWLLELEAREMHEEEQRYALLFCGYTE